MYFYQLLIYNHVVTGLQLFSLVFIHFLGNLSVIPIRKRPELVFQLLFYIQIYSSIHRRYMLTFTVFSPLGLD